MPRKHNKRNRQQQAFNRLCDRLPSNLADWTFSQRREYNRLANILNAERKTDAVRQETTPGTDHHPTEG